MTASSGSAPSSTESGWATASAGQPVTHTLRRSAPASRSARARAPASAAPWTVAPPNSHTPPRSPIQEPAAIIRGPGTSSLGDPVAEANAGAPGGAEVGHGGEAGKEGGAGVRVGVAGEGEMDVRVDETRNDGAVLQVDHLGAARRLPAAFRRPQRDDLSAAHDDRPVGAQRPAPHVDVMTAQQHEGRAGGNQRGRGEHAGSAAFPATESEAEEKCCGHPMRAKPRHSCHVLDEATVIPGQSSRAVIPSAGTVVRRRWQAGSGAGARLGGSG